LAAEAARLQLPATLLATHLHGNSENAPINRLGKLPVSELLLKIVQAIQNKFLFRAPS